MDECQNLWEQKDQYAKQTTSYYSSFPIRSSFSADDIMSDYCSPNQQQSSLPSGTRVRRTPFSQHPAPVIQPIRIDMPVTGAAKTQTNSWLTAFQIPSLLSVRMNPKFKASGSAQTPQNQDNDIHVYPIPVAKKLPQQENNTTDRTQAKHQVGITPKKQVSFQEPPNQQKQGSGHTSQKDPQQGTDLWTTEAQAKLQKQRGLHVLEFLEHEVQANAKRTMMENGRLRKLSMEWQFQKRLQEIPKRGHDEDEEDDINLERMLMIQQQKKQTEVSTVNKKYHFKILQNISERHLTCCGIWLNKAFQCFANHHILSLLTFYIASQLFCFPL